MKIHIGLCCCCMADQAGFRSGILHARRRRIKLKVHRQLVWISSYRSENDAVLLYIDCIPNGFCLQKTLVRWNADLPRIRLCTLQFYASLSVQTWRSQTFCINKSATFSRLDLRQNFPVGNMTSLCSIPIVIEEVLFRPSTVRVSLC